MESPPGVADGEAVAKEAVLEVQLGFAGTLVAAVTATVWYVLGAVQDEGFATVEGLFGALLLCSLLQLYVLDHSWFLALRGAWMATVLLARQDRRNLDRPEYWKDLETLYDAGSVRFYLGLANLYRGLLWLGLLAGLHWSAGGAVWAGIPVAAVSLVLLVDVPVAARWSRWREAVAPRVRGVWRALGWPWVDPPHRNAARRGCIARAVRLLVVAVLLILDLNWVLVARLAPEDEVVHLGDEVVLRFQLGGLRPSEDRVTIRLSSPSVAEEMLVRGTHWMGDGVVVALPADVFGLGRHEVWVERLEVRDGPDEPNTSRIGIERPPPAVFVVVE